MERIITLPPINKNGEDLLNMVFEPGTET